MILALALLGVGATGAWAHADEPYFVLTRDGSMYRGELVESVVGSHVTLRLVTGTVRRFDAIDVERQGQTSNEHSPTPSAPLPPPTVLVGGPNLLTLGVPLGGGALLGAPLAYNGPDAVHLHLAGAGQLLREGTNGWEIVCNVPCTTTVDPKATYKLGGFMQRESATFRLPSGASSLELVGQPVSSLDFGRSIRGWLLVGLAPAGILGGAALFTDGFESSSAGESPHTINKIVGGGLIGVGVLCLVGGVYLLLDAPTSTVETTSGERVARGPRWHPYEPLRLTF